MRYQKITFLGIQNNHVADCRLDEKEDYVE